MDVAKYIGLFLLKNKYCCLQGLGNLEIKKTPSAHNGTELTGSAYTAQLNPVGSIDDAFPNFIANNEQVSIAKASNEISEFIRSAKATLAEGGSVAIPSIGEYVMRNNRITFELDPAFSIPDRGIIFPVAPTPKPEERPVGEEKPYESYTNYNKQKSVNWNIIAFWGVVIIIGGGILGWSINYFMKQQQPAAKVDQAQSEVVEVPMEQPIADSTILAANTPLAASDTPEYKFIIKEYKTLAQAQKKEKQLVSYGYAVSVVNKDSATFYVVHAMKVATVDTTRIKDSLSKLLNPAGVSILR